MSEKASLLHLLHMTALRSSAQEKQFKSFSGLWTKQTDRGYNQRARMGAAYLHTVQAPVFTPS